MNTTTTWKNAVEVDLDFLRKSMAMRSGLSFSVDHNGQAYQINAWPDAKFAPTARPTGDGPLQLCTARGGVRGFKTIDAAAGVLADLGVQHFHVDLPYKA